MESHCWVLSAGVSSRGGWVSQTTMGGAGWAQGRTRRAWLWMRGRVVFFWKVAEGTARLQREKQLNPFDNYDNPFIPSCRNQNTGPRGGVVEFSNIALRLVKRGLRSPSQKLTVFRDPCALQYERNVIARSLRRKIRRKYHGLLRNHPRSQLVHG